MIPFGPMKPDAAVTNAPALRLAQNVLPRASGFGPFPAPVSIGNALPEPVRGGLAVRTATGTLSVVGTTQELYMQSQVSWVNVSATSRGGTPYTVQERWSFVQFGNHIVASNGTDPMSILDISENNPRFVEVPGAPIGFHMAVVRDFLVVGNIRNQRNRIVWSGSNNLLQWTPQQNNSGFQDRPAGGPIQGLIGGETGWVFELDGVTRMTLQPGSSLVFSFDEVEGGRGVTAPYSLTRIGRDVYYLSTDGPYKMDYGSGAAHPLGAGEWRDWFQGAVRSAAQRNVTGIAVPDTTLVMWAYTSRGQPDVVRLDRILVYNWSLNSISVVRLSLESIVPWLSAVYTLEDLDQFGTMETLPASLDSPLWQGGSPQVAYFGLDNKISFLIGEPLEALFITPDGQHPKRRTIVRATRPMIDADMIGVQLSGRESHGAPVEYDIEEFLEETGEVPGWVSGNVIRARVRVPAGVAWTYMEGVETDYDDAGRP